MFSKNSTFTALTVLTLALGIETTAAVFDFIQGVLLTPPPYPRPEEIVLITPARIDGGPYAIGSVPAQWTEWRKEAKSFDALAGYIWTFDYLILPGGSEFFQGMEVTPDYFEVIGTKPLLGRTFLEAEASAKGDTVIVLGYDFWQRRFNGDRNVLGKTMKITRTQSPLAIVGVMPPAVRFLPAFSNADFPNYDINAQVDYWIPVTPERSQGAEWHVAARLRTGITLEQANAELSLLGARQARADRKLEGITARAQLLETELNHDGRRLLLPLLGAVVLGFIIACGNAATLLLARGLQRRQEFAVRCALGAQQSRLFRQALTESLLLALAGGSLGVVLAIAIIKILTAIGGSAIPRLDAVKISWPVSACCFVSAIAATVLAGLMPALRASQQDSTEGIKGAGPTGSASRSERRLLGGVVILQTALTQALLVGAGLLIRTVENLANVRPGFSTENILTMNVTVPNWDGKQWYDFHVRSLARLSALPGVRNAAFGWGLPLTGDKFIDSVMIEGKPNTDRLADNLIVSKRSVTPDYFDALGIQIVAGRGFRLSDNLENWKGWAEPGPGETPFVCIINQAMKERCFPNLNPMGRTVRTGPWRKRHCQIVGVVANTRTEALNQDPKPEIYIPFLQAPVFTKHLIVRTVSDPHPLISAVQRELRAVDPALAIDHVKTFDEIRHASVASQIFAMRLLVGFAVMASALALIGIYSVLSLSVKSRRREIAIRMAVGAQKRSILGLVIGEGLQLVAVGLVLGIGVAIALAHVLKAFLFEVAPTDSAALMGGALLFTAVAMVACWLPASHATEIEPFEVLRCD